MKLRIVSLSLLAASLSLAGSNLHAQHGHLNAGAVGTNQNDQLLFANGGIFATNSGYIKNLDYSNSGTYAGTFNGNISLTALPATTNNGGPTLNHSALGSFIRAELVSVEGPVGGAFSFWDDGAVSPTFSVPVGTTGGTDRYDLSDAGNGAGQPGADPFGHLHGRRMSVDVDGLYTVGFRVYDVSMNGAGSGPIHTPSDVLYINFQTVPEPAAVALAGMGLGALGWQVWRKRKRG